MDKGIKIAIGCDHAALDMKNAVIGHLKEKGYEPLDVGTYTSESCDYPDIAHELCKKIQSEICPLGILICGTGIGMSIAANKHKGIRAACCSEPYSARLTRQHNDANVLCFGARVIDNDRAFELVDVFLTSKYEGMNSERHKRRLEKIKALEKDLK